MLEIDGKKQGKMNIWMLNHYAVTPDLPTGTRHFDFGMELSRRGHNITVFAYQGCRDLILSYSKLCQEDERRSSHKTVDEDTQCVIV